MLYEPTKRCADCGQSKYEGDFDVHSRTGYMKVFCRSCGVDRSRRREAADPGRVYRTFQANRSAWLVNAARARARKSGLAFDLDNHKAAIAQKFEAGCCLTGLPFNVERGGGQKWDSASIDRIEPNKGYVFANVRLVLFSLNTLFGNWGEDKAEEIVKLWLARRSNF